MPTPPPISDAEWTVMTALWSSPPGQPLTASEIVDRLTGQVKWSPRTVKTLLSRLVKKGALKYHADGNRYLYRPAVSRDDCVRRQARSFLSRVFAGDPAALLAHLARTTKLTPAELDELRRILDRKEN